MTRIAIREHQSSLLLFSTTRIAMPSTAQKALFLAEKQGSFVLGTREIPSPAAGEILVQVKAAALNPVDWKIQKTHFEFLVEKYPAFLGSDIAGDVVKLGEGVKGFSVGDRV